MKNLIFAANWKMNKGPEETKEFLQAFLKSTNDKNQSQFIIFSPAYNLLVMKESLQKSKVGWGAQNIYFEKSGAFTGENSAEVLAQMGAQHVLIGHSERRTLFNETDDQVAKKIKLAQDLNLTPMLCVGETLNERKANQTEKVVKTQVEQGLKLFDSNKPLIIAYEPVWAIGTGQVATPDQAEEVHLFIRNELKAKWGAPLSQKMPILYGGSVKPDNAKELSGKPNIDGFLIGGASLKVESYLEIYKQTI